MIEKVDSFHDLLQTVTSLAELQSFAKDLYASDLLDESEQTREWRGYGPLAPWSTPDSAESLWENGEDQIIRLSNGDLARWTNTDRAWGEVADGEDDEHLPRRLKINVSDCGTFSSLMTVGDQITVENSGGCQVEELLSAVDWDQEDLKDLAYEILAAWSDGYDGDPTEAGLAVTVAHRQERATVSARH